MPKNSPIFNLIPFYSTPTLSVALGDIETCTEKEKIPPLLGVPAYQSV